MHSDCLEYTTQHSVVDSGKDLGNLQQEYYSKMPTIGMTKMYKMHF